MYFLDLILDTFIIY